MRAALATCLAAACSGSAAAVGSPDAAPAPIIIDAAVAVPDAGWQVVHGWPALEPGYVLGQVAGVTVDATGALFVFHRADHPWFGQSLTKPITLPTLTRLDRATGAIEARFGDNRFVIPHGLHAAPDGSLWVTDVGTSLVHKLSPAGESLLVLDRGFDKPTDVFVAADGNVFVSDGYGNSRVVKLDPAGNVLETWGTFGRGPGQFDTPHSITGDADGRLYVADRGNARVQIFDQEGRYLAEWKSAELGRPWAVAATPDGSIYVVDGGDQMPPDHAAVMRLDRDGHILDRWADYGSQEGGLYWGHDLAVDGDGAVFVGDVYYGMRVQKFIRR